MGTENSGKENQEAQADKLIEELAKQKEESAKIIEQQKEILNELKEHQKKDKQAEEIAAIVDSVKQAADSQNPGNILVVQGNGKNLVQPIVHPVQPEQSVVGRPKSPFDHQPLAGPVESVIQPQKVIQQPVVNPVIKSNQPSGDHQLKETGNQANLGEVLPKAAEAEHKDQNIGQIQPIEANVKSNLVENQGGDKANHEAGQPNEAEAKPNQAGIQQNQGVQPNQAVIKPLPQEMPAVAESNVKPVEKPLAKPAMLEERHLAEPVVRKESAALDDEVEALGDKVEAQVGMLEAVGDKEAVWSGRDLKETRSKRDIERDVFKAVLDKVVNGKRVIVPEVVVAPNCLNDPFCEEKFHRDPASDSLVDRDFVKYLQVGQGGRNLLNKDETILSNLTVDRSNRSL